MFAEHVFTSDVESHYAFRLPLLQHLRKGGGINIAQSESVFWSSKCRGSKLSRMLHQLALQPSTRRQREREHWGAIRWRRRRDLCSFKENRRVARNQVVAPKSDNIGMPVVTSCFGGKMSGSGDGGLDGKRLHESTGLSATFIVASSLRDFPWPWRASLFQNC